MAVRWITEADTSEPTNPKAAKAAEAASWLLYKLTAEKYPGTTERVEWYGSDRSTCTSCINDLILGSEQFQPYLRAHSHILFDTPQQNKIRLRGTPVVSVNGVSARGVAMSPSEYWVINSTYLEKSDRSCWNLNEGIEIRYTSGINPPEPGRQAAIILANELLLADSGSSECSLPARVTSASRQGVDFTILDPQDFLESGRTGIYEIDSFIKAANPIGARKKPRVFSPDMPGGVTRR